MFFLLINEKRVIEIEKQILYIDYFYFSYILRLNFDLFLHFSKACQTFAAAVVLIL